MFEEFKEFALKGNTVDMALGIIIGAAFGTIISSLVADMIMPHSSQNERVSLLPVCYSYLKPLDALTARWI